MVRYFLILFDRSSGRMVDEVIEFVRAAEALDARFEAGAPGRDNPAIEVVVVGAEDRQALEETHGRYFRRPRT
jgi:hypothetical protein